MPYRMDIPGFMAEDDLKLITILASKVPAGGSIVEVGSWLGMSTWAWAASAPQATVYAIDTWEWMPKSYAGPGAPVDLTADPFDLFRQNVGQLPNIVPLRRQSSGGDWEHGPADIVFIDAMHQDPWVSNDVLYWEKRVRPSGLICGDDYAEMFPAVKGAAAACAARLGSKLETPGRKFWLVRVP